MIGFIIYTGYLNFKFLFCSASKPFWGQTETARVTYTVIVLENSQTTVCCEGYDALTNSFHTIGCGNTESSIR